MCCVHVDTTQLLRFLNLYGEYPQLLYFPFSKSSLLTKDKYATNHNSDFPNLLRTCILFKLLQSQIEAVAHCAGQCITKNQFLQYYVGFNKTFF